MAKLFGTDGIRGTVNAHPMTSRIAMDVAVAAGHIFRENLSHRPTVLIAKDTRLSGYQIEPAMVSGFTSAGWDVLLLGPMPTPAVAALTRSMRADMGVMLSASHNPYQDNGIKLFGPQGFKLSRRSRISRSKQRLSAWRKKAQNLPWPTRTSWGACVGLMVLRGGIWSWSKPPSPTTLRLDGMKVAVDCANGAAYRIAPRILYELGADVIEYGVEPNGLNINDQCGATAPKGLRLKVLETGADIGLALDGDADRLIVVDEQGPGDRRRSDHGADDAEYERDGPLAGRGLGDNGHVELGLGTLPRS